MLNIRFFLHVNWELLLSVWSEMLRERNHRSYTSHRLYRFVNNFFFFLFRVAVCFVCASPQPSLNQEGRSEKRLWSTTSVFLLCVRETSDGCLSCSHANAGPGTMATAGPDVQKAEVSRRAEEVIGFLMAITVVSWERPWLGPLCCADGQPPWECSLYKDDSGDTYDQRPRLCYPQTFELEQ